MLFMVIERFRSGNPLAVGERFQRLGRLMPENLGLTYVTSWMATGGDSCYQVMQAPDRAALDPWLASWTDLVDFEVVPITPSAEFWKHVPRSP